MKKPLIQPNASSGKDFLFAAFHPLSYADLQQTRILFHHICSLRQPFGAVWLMYLWKRTPTRRCVRCTPGFHLKHFGNRMPCADGTFSQCFTALRAWCDIEDDEARFWNDMLLSALAQVGMCVEMFVLVCFGCTPTPCCPFFFHAPCGFICRTLGTIFSRKKNCAAPIVPQRVSCSSFDPGISQVAPWNFQKPSICSFTLLLSLPLFYHHCSSRLIIYHHLSVQHIIAHHLAPSSSSSSSSSSSTTTTTTTTTKSSTINMIHQSINSSSSYKYFTKNFFPWFPKSRISLITLQDNEDTKIFRPHNSQCQEGSLQLETGPDYRKRNGTWYFYIHIYSSG